jgi:hypothetical protein
VIGRLSLVMMLVACHGGEWTPPGGSNPTAWNTSDTANQPWASTTVAGGQLVTGGDTAPPLPDLPHETADTAWVPVPVEPLVPDVTVDCNGGGDFLTIQAAIDGSVSGTKIGVQPCVYDERIDYRGKSLNLFGIEGSSRTILDGGGSGPIVTATRGESDGTRFAGFTLTGGRNTDGAAAVEVQLSYLDMDDLLITGNLASDYMIYTNGAIVTLTGSTITGNAADGGSDAPIYLDTGVFVMTNSTVTCDGSDDGLYTHNATIVLDSDVRCDGGSAIWVDGGEIHLRRSHAEGSGESAVHAEDKNDNPSEKVHIIDSEVIGGTQGLYAEYMNIIIENSTLIASHEAADLESCQLGGIIHDSIFVGGQCDLKTSGTPFLATWNAVANQGNCGITPLYSMPLDPMFVAPPDDLHLAPGSPAIDAGDPDPAYNDPDGTRNDLGRYGGPEAFGPP